MVDYCRRLQSDYSNLKERYVKVLGLNEKVIAEQKTEIERLTRELDDTISMNEMYIKQVRQNAELQQQIDELKDICLDCPYKLKFDEIEKQAVKDTAKEILQEGKYCLSKSLRDWIKEHYGVEVE